MNSVFFSVVILTMSLLTTIMYLREMISITFRVNLRVTKYNLYNFHNFGEKSNHNKTKNVSFPYFLLLCVHLNFLVS